MPSFLDEKKLIFNAVKKSRSATVSYRQLPSATVWMFSFGTFNNLINGTHKRSLRTVYDAMMMQEALLKLSTTF